MSDPISRLDQFRADAHGAPMKSAAEVRQRGDQIRRRRRAVVAAGAAAVAAAVAGPIVFLSTGIGDKAIDPAPPVPSVTDSPTPSPTSSPSSNASADRLTEANLLSTSDIGAVVGPGLTVAGDATSYLKAAGVGEIPCDLSSALSGTSDALGYAYGFSAAEGGDGDADRYFSEAVAQFEPGKAQAAYDGVKAKLAECSPDGADQFDERPWQPVQIPVTGTAELGGAGYGPTTAEPGNQYDTSSGYSWVFDVGIIVSGDRVAIVADLATRANTDDASSTVGDLLPVAARRLTGPPTGDTPPSAPAADQALSDANLPAAEALPQLDRFGSGPTWEAYTPASDLPTLACQKNWLNTLDPVEKRTRDFHTVTESTEVGQVHVAVLEFADVNAAGAAYNEVMEWQEVCPATKLGADPDVTSLPKDVSADLDAGPKRAARSQATYPGPGDGDGTWFETELVAQYETRLVLLGYAELAGPCPPSTGDKDDPCYQPDQPDSWPGRVLEIEKAAVTAGISDLR